METVTHYLHLRICDNDSLGLLRFDGKLRFKKGDETYCSLAAKTVNDDGAWDNHVRRATLYKLREKGVVLEERDDGWMIIETANDR